MSFNHALCKMPFLTLAQWKSKGEPDQECCKGWCRCAREEGLPHPYYEHVERAGSAWLRGHHQSLSPSEEDKEFEREIARFREEYARADPLGKERMREASDLERLSRRTRPPAAGRT